MLQKFSGNITKGIKSLWRRGGRKNENSERLIAKERDKDKNLETLAANQRHKDGNSERSAANERHKDENSETLVANEREIFSYETLLAATDNFNPRNKYREFIYKGNLKDGRKVTVEMLSETWKGGREEFIKEAQLLSSLQHPQCGEIVWLLRA